MAPGRGKRKRSKAPGDVNERIQELNKKISRCPHCDLPLLQQKGADKAYCATCEEYFSVDTDDRGRKKVKILPKKKNKKFKFIVGAVAVLVVIIFVSFTMYWVFVEEEKSGRISIDEISEIRKLPVHKDVPPRTMSKSDLKDYIQESIDDERIVHLREEELFYKCMFIVEDEVDLVKIAQNSTGAGIAGFYDPETDEMYVIGNTHSNEYINYILSHEYTHALQDQNYDLIDYMDTGYYDKDIARLAAIEGDAMTTMDMWADENLNQVDMFFISVESLIEIIPSIDEMVTGYSNQILSIMQYFPYQDGMAFVQKVYNDEGWDGVNALFTDEIPLSTEQILHYDKYLSYEEPEEIEFRGDVGDLSLRFTSNAGEKLISEILRYYTRSAIETLTSLSITTTSLAPGWGGDKFFYYENGEDFLSVFKTSWDTEIDNGHFNTSYDSVLNTEGSWVGEFGGYWVNDNYALKVSSGSTTTIYYSNSLDIITQALEDQ